MFNGRKRQTDIYIPGMSGIKPRVPVDTTALERAAQRKMSPAAFAYMAGGAGREQTMSNNREAFHRWRIVPRMLRDTSQRDLSVSLLGQTLPTPLLLAPIGVLELAHPDGDLAVARAASAEGVPMIFSNQASYPMEATATAMGDVPYWFQLYYSSNDELVKSLVQRAENAGCGAIVVTLDTTLLGWRTRDLDLAYLPFMRGMGIAQYTSDPVFNARIEQPAPSDMDQQKPKLTPSLLRSAARLRRTYPDGDMDMARRAVREFVGTYSRPSLTWDDISRLRDLTRLPILLKGILHPEDAKIALERGLNGLIVSNHGGRQVDGSIAALDALPMVVEAVNGAVPVLMDSGIRGGSDIIKALALGATAVCLGRPYAYGLAIDGEAGVRAVLQNIKADFDLTMGLAGIAAARDISREVIVRAE